MPELSHYKICPNCGAHNSPKLFECEYCSTDITSVPATTDELEAKKHQEETPVQCDEGAQETKAISYERICQCGQHNEASSRKCSSCGEDISDIMPTPKAEEQQERYVLTDVDGKYSFVIPTGVILIGREQEMKDYLESKPFVSRCHAKIIKSSEGLYIENMSKTNYTFVNNRNITGERTKLSCGDEIELGGTSINGERQNGAAYFIVGLL